MERRDPLDVLGDVLSLPSLPDVVVRLNALIEDPDAGAREVGEAVAGDPALAARVLRLANSSYYGLAQPVVSAHQAATVIGLAALKNIVLEASILDGYGHLSRYEGFDLEGTWAHAMQVARLAQLLGKATPRPLALSPDELYTCGLLHDIGQVVLLEALGEEYVRILAGARERGVTTHAAEEAALGFNHVDVGALVARGWSLPGAIATAIEHHHDTGARLRDMPFVAALAIADQASYQLRARAPEESLARLAGATRILLSIEPETFSELLERVRAAGSGITAA